MTKENKSKFWNFIDNLEGDKVVWMIAILLILSSIVAIFSSTSLLAIEQGTTRVAIIREQIIVSLAGLAIIIGLYNIKGIKFFQICAQLGFIASAGLLTFLASHMDLGFIKAQNVNEAWRTIRVFGFQFHVFEFTKVAMVMYLAWAMDASEKGQIKAPKFLSKIYYIKNMSSDARRDIFYIYAPIGIIAVLIAMGSVSSAMFITLVMAVTIVIGGVKISEVIRPLLIIAVIAGGGAFMVYKATDGKVFNRFETATNRIKHDNYMDTLRTYVMDKSSMKFQNAADKLRQPVGAKVAIKEGGLTGKGPGNSTQRYVVSVMFGDYMFSFICEEYGLLGGIVIMILYISLLARGSMIVRNCKSTFAKATVAGLTVLITGQAYMHMLINIDIGLLTGQTLPMISHGTSSFLMFCIAFGVILSISRMAKKQIDRETKEILQDGPLALKTYADVEDPNAVTDELRQSITDVEEIEDQFEL